MGQVIDITDKVFGGLQLKLNRLVELVLGLAGY